MSRSWMARALGVCLLVAGAFTGCDNGSSPTGGGNNFTISISLANPTLSLEQGGSGTVGVTLERGGGYTGTVSLTVEGMPTGVSATADPASLAAGATSSTITVSAGAAASPGTYTLTVQATGSEVTAATATLNLTVTEAPGFSLALSPTSLTIQQGESGTSSATVTRVGGFSGAVALTVTGAPTGMSVTSDPGSVTGTSSTLTVSVAGSVDPGAYPLTVTGTAAGLSDQTATLTVTVTEAPAPSFSLNLTPSSLSIAQGDNGTSAVDITRDGGFDGEVALSVNGVPAGVTATPDPATTAGATSTLTVSVDVDAAPGTYTLTVTGTASGLADQTADLELTITAVVTGSFTLAMSPPAISVQQGASETSTVEITRTGGFDGDVALSVSGMPQGMTAEFSPAGAPGEGGDGPQGIAGNSATLTVTVDGTVAPNDYTLTVTGTADGLADETTTLAVTVTAAPSPSFSLTLNPSSLSLAQGGNGTSTIEITRSGGFTGEVALAVTGIPAGVTAAPDPAGTTGTTSTLSVAVGAGVAPGAYSLTVTGSAGGLDDQTANLDLTVTTSGGGQEVTWTFCEENGTPLWFAVQDGSGPWTQVVGVNDTYTFTLNSDKAGIAYVTGDAFGNYQTSLFYMTSANLGILGGSQCESPGETTKTVHGSVAGLSLTDQATITLGGAYASVLGTLAPTFTLQNVAQGIQDLIAARTATTVGGGGPVQEVDKLLFRRGLNPPDGSTLDVLDFGGAEAFDPVTRNLTIDNLGTDEAAVGLSYFTDHGASASLFSGLAAGASQTFPAVPGARQEAGDLHILSVTAAPAGAGADHTRGVTSMFHDAADQTVSLGPDLGTVAVSTVANAPYLRLRAQYTIQSEYDGAWVLNLGPEAGNGVSFVVTAGYLGGGGAFDQTVPDFSGVAGWQDAWGMTSGASVNWFMSATGWTSSGGIITSPYVEGGRVLSASRFGAINP